MSWLEDAKIQSLGDAPKQKTKKQKTKKVTALPDFFVPVEDKKRTIGDLYTEFTGVLMDAGFILSDGLQEASGDEPVRCDMADAKSGTKPAWYYFRVVGNAAFATYGDWRYGGYTKWASYTNKQPTQKEVAEINEAIKIQAEAAKKKRDELAEMAKRYVQTRINSLPPLKDHPYFNNKKINQIIPQSYLYRMTTSRSLATQKILAVIPLYNTKGEICNWQTINEDGEKRFRKYAKKKGHFNVIGDLKGANNVVYCEGFATGASIYLSISCAVIVCFDAGNILPVMDETHELVANKSIYIAADNDANEIGIKKAEAARDKYGHTKIAMPVLVGTDFNDVWCEHGGDNKAIKAITEAFVKVGYEKKEVESVRVWDGEELETLIPELISKAPTPKIQAIADWMFATAPKASEQAALLGAITFACGVAGREFRENEMGNYSCIQACLIAPSGAGKDFLKKCIQKVLSRSDVLKELIGASSYTSGAAVRNQLIQNPVKISCIDEFGDKLTGAMKGNGRDAEAFESFKELYSDARGEWVGRAYAMIDPTNSTKKDYRAETIMNPSLTLLGLSTPQQFVGAITESHVEGGFLNRFIVVDTTGVKIKRKRKVVLDMPDWIVQHTELVVNQGKSPHAIMSAGNLTDLSKDYSNPAEPKEVIFPEEASDMLWDFMNYLDDQYEHNVLMSNISVRWAENARRMAVGLAAYENPMHPRVTVDLINWCITYVQFHGKKLAALIDRYAHHDDYHKLRNECLEAIRATKMKGMSKSEMNNAKPFRGLKLEVRDKILVELERMGAIGINIGDVDNGSKVVYYGTKRNT